MAWDRDRNSRVTLGLGLPDAAVGAGLLLLVALSPLPWGANRAWAWLLLAAVACLLFAVQTGSDVLARHQAGRDLRRLWPAIVAWLLVLAWIWLQTCSWTPQAWHHPGYESAGVSGAISVEPERTAQFGLRLAAYGMIFWIAVRLARSIRWARIALVTVGAAAAALSLYAIVTVAAGDSSAAVRETGISATFANRNSFATYAGIGLVVLGALLAERLVDAMAGDHPGGRARMRAALACLAGEAAPYLIGAVLCAAALAMTGSRGGILATGAALAVVALCHAGAGRRHGGIVAAGLLAVILVATALHAGDLVLGRLVATEVDGTARLIVYERTLEASRATWWQGTGAGTFLEVFRPYKDAGLGRLTWDLGHNSYLENVLELGWPAAVLLYAALVLVVARCLRGTIERRSTRVYPLVALAASVLVGLHAAVDFSLQMPAVAATYALLLGVGYARSWPPAGSGAGSEAAADHGVVQDRAPG